MQKNPNQSELDTARREVLRAAGEIVGLVATAAEESPNVAERVSFVEADKTVTDNRPAVIVAARSEADAVFNDPAGPLAKSLDIFEGLRKLRDAA